jgi:hypothetical protein
MKLTATVMIAFAVCACAWAAASQRSPERDTPPSSATHGWALAYSSGSRLETNRANQPVVAIPSNGTLNMMTKAWIGPAAGTILHVTVQVQTTGAPEILLAQGPEPTCRTPPSTRPYLEANGWTTMPPAYRYMRWWSRQGFIALARAGTFTITVPLTPDRWSGVNGQLATENASSLSWFNQMATAMVPGRAGLVFGGGRSYGHGLSVVGGSATVTVVEFEARN